MKNILVGINHLDQSSILLHHALKIALFFDATLTIAHIIQPGTYEISDADLMQAKLSIEEIESRKEEIKVKRLQLLKDLSMRTSAKQFEGLSINYRVEFGTPDTALRDIATETPTNLMMIASQYESSFITRFVSNERKDIVKNAPCPVLMIPNYAKYQGLNRLVYATDFHFDDLEALLFLQTWAATFKAKVLCIHVCETETDKPVATQKMESLQKLFPKIEPHIFVGDVVGSIDEYLRLSHADLIATTTHKRGLWRTVFATDVTDEIAKDTPVPMLVFKEK
jgi:nucleotide-binding universal stress UspA family protein